jgi:hypothetical protein
VTNTQIRALRDEAAAAGDMAQVELCDRALAGDKDDASEVRGAIEDAPGEPGGGGARPPRARGPRRAHFTRFGIATQPHEADSEGYLAYRSGYEDLPEAEQTAAERWISAQEQRIAEWRGNK